MPHFISTHLDQEDPHVVFLTAGVVHWAMNDELQRERTVFWTRVHVSKEQNMSLLLPLPAIDGVEITTIMDNALDLLMASTPVAKRFPIHREMFSSQQLRAEHGVSLLVTALNQGKRETILFDTGVTP